jgi:diguanylate cyclase (GGDEF)-like protein
VKGVVLVVELCAAGFTALSIATTAPTAHMWRMLGVLLVLAIVFEEASRRVGRLRLLITDASQTQDMTSVWTFAGALVVPAGYAAAFACVIAAHAWLRQQWFVGGVLFRRIYSAGTVMLACLAASAVAENGHLQGAGSVSWTDAAIVIAALCAYTLTNRTLVLGAIFLAGAPRDRAIMLGSWEDNALELATLSLGYMTALILVHQPLLAITCVVPMVLLQRAALVTQLEHAASTDAKTQLLTPLAWRQRADRELSLSRFGAVSLLVLDLDDFKVVNDLHGHLAGDAALLATSARIRAELRPSDVVGRFGGEEFVVLLPGLNTDGALAVAERLRLRIGAIRLAELQPGAHADGTECSHTLSTSIGVAVFPEDGAGLSDLIAAADRALYIAKRSGRNAVVLTERAADAAG